ncbi:fatty acid cis/trans isomerase [Chitinibacter bivalviorum]|uniref:Fatty acid cis/trans isomerase n=1 Tax=Chitinibacter bivalviorum TaxID=2739434 RepID=A0A7H9BKP1_9NEIS|nr:fatty acid cis/trans isomerase [Chitinibacter bivalviorum]QLG88942.1 fatty acid cis/trans isomerase [Chitinibacter bivalviorum]
MKQLVRHLPFIALLALLSACSAISQYQWQQKYGQAETTRYDVPATPKKGDVYYHDVQPILEARCAVCHGCYDAPCQLKLTAWEGIARGANPNQVYGDRLKAVPPTRLFEDAMLASQWRERGFHAVLNENNGISNIDGSVLAQMLKLKQQNPLPKTAVLSNDFDFSLGREQQCTTIENFAKFAHKNPLWGMPFGLQGLSSNETEFMLKWISQGAPREAEPPLSPILTQQIAQWEQWLNRDSLKSQLSSRYIYEHLFLAHLYFGDDKTFFKIVRSRTPPGKSVDLIATARPYDDPGVERVYYRLTPVKETILNKTHMPYRLDTARMQQWQRWFIDAPYTVSKLPSYTLDVATNPFIAFEQLPIDSRYRFMLEEAQFTVMGFIKGPVCRGNMALNVINDRFWVFFRDPDTMNEREVGQFLIQNSSAMALPDQLGNSAPILADWSMFADAQLKYLKARVQYIQQRPQRKKVQAEQLIWDGDGHNPNAALTIFRNYDNATVEQGLLGDAPPQTAWVIDYPLLERFHYLLVAGFDVFGNIGHQLKTRLYMDFLRIEGEQNFLSTLPDPAHIALQNQWYRGAPKNTQEYLSASALPLEDFVLTVPASLAPEQAYEQMLQRFKQRISADFKNQFALSYLANPKLVDALTQLQQVKGVSLQWLPQDVVIKVLPKQGKPIWLTLLNDSAYKNVAQLFFDQKRRLPAEDKLTLVNGFIGAYPNAFWVVNEAQLPQLTQAVAQLNSEADYTALMDQFGVRRTSDEFWAFSDEVHQVMKAKLGINYGLFDYNRLENR